MDEKQISRCLVLALVALLTAGCGGGGSKLSQKPQAQATITADNARDILIGVTRGIGVGYSTPEYNDILSAIQTIIENGDISTASVPGSCAIPGNIEFPENLTPQGTISGSLTFNDFCVDGGVYVGEVIFNGDADFAITYDQMAITKLDLQFKDSGLTANVQNGESVGLNGSASLSDTSFDMSLTISYDVDGRIYQAKDLDITGYGVNGYKVNAGSVSDPRYGEVEIQSKNNVVYDDSASCGLYHPLSGAVVATGSGGDNAEVIYDCKQYTVCTNAGAVCNQYAW